jgi:hypothetical protein
MTVGRNVAQLPLTGSGDNRSLGMPPKSGAGPVGKNQDRKVCPKSIILKGQRCNLLPMPIRARHIPTIVAILIAGFAVSGCGTINAKLADGLGEYIPQWAGGLPPDAPPRPGTAKYEEFMRERERKRLEPAVTTNDTAKTSDPTKSNASLDPVH